MDRRPTLRPSTMKPPNAAAGARRPSHRLGVLPLPNLRTKRRGLAASIGRVSAAKPAMSRTVDYNAKLRRLIHPTEFVTPYPIPVTCGRSASALSLSRRKRGCD